MHPVHAPQPSLHPHAYAYYSPPPPPNPPARRTSPVVWVLVAMGLMTVLGGLLGTCGLVGGLIVLGASQDGPTGVVLGAQVPQPTVEALKARNLLKNGETLLAYHDATLRLDMGDVALVTSSRVVHAHGETAAAMALVDVSTITHRQQGLLGDIIDITSSDGRTMRVQIAPLNGGEAYVDALEQAWQAYYSEAQVTHLTGAGRKPASKAGPTD